MSSPAPGSASWSARWLIPTRDDALLYAPLVVGLLLPVLFAPELAPKALRYVGFVIVVCALGDRVGRHTLPGLDPGARQSLAPVLGTSLVVVLEAIVARLGQPALGALLGPLALVAMMDRCRDAPAVPTGPSRSRVVQCLVAFAVVGVMLYVACLPTLPPTPSRPALVYQDTVWTAGNTESIAHWGLPLRDVRVDGVTFGYHVGQNLLGAARQATVGGSAFAATVTFDPIFLAWTLPVTLVACATVWLGLSVPAAALLTAALCLTDSLVGGVQSNTFPSPISYAFSLPPLLMATALVLGHLRGRATVSPLPLLLLGFAAFSGKLILIALWPLGCLAGMVALCVHQRRAPQRIEGWAAGAVAAAALLAAALLLGSGGSDPPEAWASLPNSRLTGLLAGPLHAPSLVPYAHFVGRLLREAGRLLSWLPVGLLVATTLGSRQARQDARQDAGLAFGVGFAAVTLTFGSAIFLRGGSTYFLLYAEVVLLLALADRFDLLWATSRGRAATLLSMVVGMMALGFWQRGFCRSWVFPPWTEEKAWDPRATISRDEWEACTWLHDHSPPEAHFVSNRLYFRHETMGDEISRVFWCSALAARISWREGSGFMPQRLLPEAERRRQVVERIFSTPPAERDSLLATLPINYVVQSTRFGGDRLPESPRLRLRYSTPSAYVYEVLSAGNPF